MTAPLSLVPLAGFPLVEPGDDLAGLIAESLAQNALRPGTGDVLVLAQKIVSKAEGRYVRLAEVTPGPEALALAAKADKDPRLVELILAESNEVIRVRPGVIIVEHRNGYVLANAGIDRSNIASSPEDPRVLLLPEDADRSAARLRTELGGLLDSELPVLINDSVGRAWRNGTVGIAIGCAGFDPLNNQVGERDLFGNVLEVTEPAIADELAAAASLVMGQAAEACPAVLARGVAVTRSDGDARALLRDKTLDMFR
jgi:coenzyme F420-0:L-glutamate ligase/coenzyme F420-1:gamma-L-glutamate ligase